MGLPEKYLSTNLVQERKENFIDSHVASLCLYITEPQLLLSCAVLACNLCVLCLDAAFSFADHMMLLTLDAQWLALCLLSVCIIYLLTSRLYSKTQNWTKFCFCLYSCCSLSFEVGQTSRSSISRSFMPKKKIAALQTSKTQSLLTLQHPF